LWKQKTAPANGAVHFYTHTHTILSSKQRKNKFAITTFLSESELARISGINRIVQYSKAKYSENNIRSLATPSEATERTLAGNSDSDNFNFTPQHRSSL